MGSHWERTMRWLVALAACIMLQARAAGQEHVAGPAVGIPGAPTGVLSGVPSGMPSGVPGGMPDGVINPPVGGTNAPEEVNRMRPSEVAIPPGCWPAPCTKPPVPDPLQSLCPDECNSVIMPPRCPWYVASDAIALRREFQNNINFATINDPGDIALSSRFDCPDYKAGTRVMLGHTFGPCLQV
jgi:hypothetical protein